MCTTTLCDAGQSSEKYDNEIFMKIKKCHCREMIKNPRTFPGLFQVIFFIPGYFLVSKCPRVLTTLNIKDFWYLNQEQWRIGHS